MRCIAMVALAGSALACGSSSHSCSDEFGQDCGPTLTVTLRYVLDGGLPNGDGSACEPEVLCNVTKQMPAAQYYFAVVTGVGCTATEPSENTRLIDCTEDVGGDSGVCLQVQDPPRCLCGSAPRGAFRAACGWSPPLLVP